VQPVSSCPNRTELVFLIAARDAMVRLVLRGSGGLAQSSDGPPAGWTRSETEEAVEAALSFCPVNPIVAARWEGSHDAARLRGLF
jgi:hypothetical protein